MRSLALAELLRSARFECIFLSREHSGHLCDFVEARGFQVLRLPTLQDASVATSLSKQTHGYKHWLGTSEKNDADQTIAWLRANPAHLVVVDHYALGANWEEQIRPWCKKILAIDDLANRRHDCDILLDQNLGRQLGDYEGLIPVRCERLIGPRYALLRPEFAQLRQASIFRRKKAKGRCSNILVSLGGIDKDNVTSSILEAIETAQVASDVRLNVVLGSRAPFKDQVIQHARRMPIPTEVHIDASNMAELMLQADLAIGASGSTSWERCCMGLPSIQVVLSENQVKIADSLKSAGAASVVRGPELSLELHACLRELLNDTKLVMEQSKRASKLVDGFGAARVAKRLMNM